MSGQGLARFFAALGPPSKPTAFRPKTRGAPNLERITPAKAGPKIPDKLSCMPFSAEAEGNSSSATIRGTAEAQAGPLIANPVPSRNTPDKSSNGLSIPAQPSNARAPADPASHRLVTRIILDSFTASASAPAGSVNRKNGNDARLVIKDMKSPDDDIKFIVQVAAVS